MTLDTQQSLSGFIATEPELSRTVNDDARFHARIGQPHYRRPDDGTDTELAPSFGALVLYGRTAESAHGRFRKGDRFVAEGHVREYQYTLDSEPKTTEQFIAAKIGHDTARTTYAIDRTPVAEQARRRTEQAAAEVLPDGAVNEERPIGHAEESVADPATSRGGVSSAPASAATSEHAPDHDRPHSL